MAVPYTFANATTSIPLSQLDSNFSTAITLGNTATYLGNTIATINNLTLGNVTISSGSSTLSSANVTNFISSNVTVSGGTVNGAVIGGSSSAAGTFTTLTTSGAVSLERAITNYRITEKNTATSSTANDVGFEFYMKDSGGADQLYGFMLFQSTTITAGAEQASFALGTVAGGANVNLITAVGQAISMPGSLAVTGSVSKGSGSFRISHPLPSLTDTHHLVHSFIEGPQADLIYRGVVILNNGTASVNIDEAAGMTEGTFEALCRGVQCFTSNETSWVHVRGVVSGNVLTIEAQDQLSTARVSWMVIGERKDKHMYDTDWTDDDGKVIVEPLKPVDVQQEISNDN